MFQNVPIYIRAILSQFHGIGSCAKLDLLQVDLHCIAYCCHSRSNVNPVRIKLVYNLLEICLNWYKT